MTYTSKPNSLSFRFLFVGGWTAIKSATIGSIFAVFITLAFQGIYSIGQNGLQTIKFNSYGFQSFLSPAALLLLVAILFSALPAFIGGVLLAWFLNQKNSATPIRSINSINLGAAIGACAGVVLALVILIPVDFLGRTAHGGYGYNLLKSLPAYTFYVVEFITIATIAGMWTDCQLRKYFEKERSKEYANHAAIT